MPAVLGGVRDISSERWTEDAALVRGLRDWLWAEALLHSRLLPGRDAAAPAAAKFRDYFDCAEPIRSVSSHRALAMFRGRALELLDVKLRLDSGAARAAPASPIGSPAKRLQRLQRWQRARAVWRDRPMQRLQRVPQQQRDRPVQRQRRRPPRCSPKAASRGT